MATNATIQIDSNVEKYTCGESVYGTVTIECATHIFVKDITVSLVGSVEISSSNLRCTHPENPDLKHHRQVTFYRQPVVVFPPPGVKCDNDCYRLDGTQSFPFIVHFPCRSTDKMLPGSVSRASPKCAGAVVYHVKALVRPTFATCPELTAKSNELFYQACADSLILNESRWFSARSKVRMAKLTGRLRSSCHVQAEFSVPCNGTRLDRPEVRLKISTNEFTGQLKMIEPRLVLDETVSLRLSNTRTEILGTFEKSSKVCFSSQVLDFNNGAVDLSHIFDHVSIRLAEPSFFNDGMAIRHKLRCLFSLQLGNKVRNFGLGLHVRVLPEQIHSHDALPVYNELYNDMAQSGYPGEKVSA